MAADNQTTSNGAESATQRLPDGAPSGEAFFVRRVKTYAELRDALIGAVNLRLNAVSYKATDRRGGWVVAVYVTDPGGESS